MDRSIAPFSYYQKSCKAITIKDSDTEQAIAALAPDTYNLIRIEKRAFVKMSEEMI